MVIGKLLAPTVDFVFAGYGIPAFATPDHACERERPGLARHAWASQEPLDEFEFVQRDHRLMLSRKDLAFRYQDAGVELVRKDTIHRTQRDGLSTDTLSAHGAEPPLLCRNLPDPPRRVRTREH